VAGLENGTLRPVIGKKFPLAEAAQAHRAVMKPGAIGKIVLVIGSKNQRKLRSQAMKGQKTKSEFLR
jgi:hypothetical protein